MGTNTLHFLTEQAVAGLLTGNNAPDRPFCGQRTYGDIHAMAHVILDRCPAKHGQRGYLAIFTTDRAVIAAAIIAALAGGPILILPHDISDGALMDLASDPEYTWVVADPGRTLPSRFKALWVTPAGHSPNPIPLKAAIDPDAPLLKLYTGGSTGKPAIWTKTVENIMGEALFHVGVHDITCDDVVVATVPPYHIYGLLFSVAAPLLAGARVADQTCGFPHEIVNTVTDTAATILVSVPAHFRALKDHDFPDHGLRLAFSSAGVLDEADERAFRQRNSVLVMEVYGSTETGGIAFRCRGRDETFFSPFTVIETHIEEETLKIRSPFISPEIVRDDLGFYLVPDRVKQCSDNCFAILGRSDTVVKIAGIRVDLDKVGAVLKTMDGIRDALVLARPVPRGRAFDICALVEANCTHADIRQFLSGRLEAAAHPRWIKVVDQMPVTRSGKYDRAAVAALFEPDED
ncbi:AMP-binding protein [Desulfobacter vibrioformis]|uniref:AMP-binding protein n=1 Tax=Desulfobacter vibrioformis TaxID=34031 RepID=UPI000555A369|nr:class I adenylate-forming enzyme family protein [Desulfobacter vibrioformis]